MRKHKDKPPILQHRLAFWEHVQADVAEMLRPPKKRSRKKVGGDGAK